MKFIKIILLTGLAILAFMGIIGSVFQDNPNFQYPKLEIYKSGYNPDKNNYLRFNGFYDSNIDDVSYDKTALYSYLQPIFFFADGSFCYYSVEMNSVNFFENAENIQKGLTWGNYKIQGDTITMESLPYEHGVFWSKYRKVIHKGIISDGNINLFYSKGPGFLPLGNLNFILHSQKPDSTLNWIRNEEYFN